MTGHDFKYNKNYLCKLVKYKKKKITVLFFIQPAYEEINVLDFLFLHLVIEK